MTGPAAVRSASGTGSPREVARRFFMLSCRLPAGGFSLMLRGLDLSYELNNDEIRRYSRHLILPEVGLAGQKKICSTTPFFNYDTVN